METEKLVPKDSEGGLKNGVIDKKEQKGHDGKKKQRVQRSKFRRYIPHVLVGIIVMGTLRVVCSNMEEWPTPIQLHIIFGVIGYQVLMGHGTLIIHTMAHKDFFFFPNTNKKKLHWITQVLGAVCVVAATCIIYCYKENHFNSIHGILGLLSLILTIVSSLNGVIFLWWQELGIGKGNIKFLHTLTGALTFILSTLCLMYGYNKKIFFKWTSAPVAYGLMAVCLVSIAVFSLSPGRIILNKLMSRDHDKPKDEKDQNGSVKASKDNAVKEGVKSD